MSTPYSGSPFDVGATPVTIQAEHYDRGGEGIAYHDTTSTNTAGAFRTGADAGVDIKQFATGQYRISDAYVGEWVLYSINVQQAGTYKLELRVSNADPNAKLHVEVDGVNVTGAWTVPDTGNFNTMTTIAKTVTLAAGTSELKLSFDVGAGPTGSVAGVDWLRLSPTTTSPSSGTNVNWTAVAPSPVKRAEAQGAVVNGKLYVFGGLFVQDGKILATPRSDVYDPATNKWTRIADQPEKFTHSPTVVVGNTIWFIGGYVGDHPGPGSRKVYKYNTSTNAWSRGPDLPASRGAGGAGLIGNKIYFFGGTNKERDQERGNLYVLDLGNQSAGWKELASMPNPRNHLAGVALNGYLYAIGGQHGQEEEQEAQRDIHRYDPATNTWTKVAELPFGRSHINAPTFVMNGKIVIVGGETGFGQPIRNVTVFDPMTNKTYEMTPLPEMRSTSIAGVLPDGRIITATGNSPTPTATTWIGTISA